MVLAERIHLPTTYAEDILTEITGGNLPFRLPPAADQCRDHHRVSLLLCTIRMGIKQKTPIMPFP